MSSLNRTQLARSQHISRLLGFAFGVISLFSTHIPSVFAESPSKIFWIKPRTYVPSGNHSAKAQGNHLQWINERNKDRGAHVQLGAVSAAQLRLIKKSPSVGPERIGFSRYVKALANSDSTSRGLDWVMGPDGVLTGHFTIQSEGAFAMRMGLEFERLPDATEFRFHDLHLDQVILVTGAEIREIFRKNQSSLDFSPEASVYWSPIVQGTTVGLEVRLPEGLTSNDLKFHVSAISHLTLNPGERESSVGTVRAAACNLDSRCYSEWSATSNAVAQISFISGAYSYLCTGTLLNDSSSSNTPYFLTANHCISNQASASTINSYWFYYASTCNSHEASSALRQVTGGGMLLYTSAATDASFLELTGPLPSGVTFSGWTNSVPSLGVSASGLHNPLGDLQKISFWLTAEYENCQPVSDDSFTCSPATESSASFINVQQLSGTTEGGSSGSGIFLGGNQYLFGQLYGGNASCTNPSGDTIYGLFGRTYSNGNLGQWLVSSKQSQVVTIGAPTSLAVGQSAPVSASASSGLPVSLSSATPTICSVGAGKVSGLTSGRCNILGSQEGNSNYRAAQTVAAIPVTLSSQTLTITAPATLAINQIATLSGQSSAGLPVVLTTTTPDKCLLQGSDVRGIQTGACVIQGTQSGSMSFSSASTTANIEIIKSDQTISLVVPSSLQLGETAQISASASSGLPVTVRAQTPSICSITGEVLKGSAPGTCQLEGLQAGNDQYRLGVATATVAVDSPQYPGPTRKLSVRKLGAGSVESNPAGIQCGSRCQYAFTRGTFVVLTARPDDGHSFIRWQGACGGRSLSCRVKMTAIKNVRALFR